MKYFIDASLEIIEKDGIEGVTIRKVADLAGYNSATLYNYFENIDHLLFYSSLKYLRNYLLRLKDLEMPENQIHRFLVIWRCFADEAFRNPNFFYHIFYVNHDMAFNDAVKQYYAIYPEELANISEELLPMLRETNLYQRDLELLGDCVDAGFIHDYDLEPINDMIVMIFQGMVMRAKEPSVKNVEMRVDLFIDYIKRIFKAHLIEPVDDL